MAPQTDAPGAWEGRAGILAVQSRIEQWAAGRQDVLALVLFGSLTRTDRPGDDWSDIDAFVVVEEPEAWRENAGAAWLSEIGPTWLNFLHPAPLPGLVVHQAMFAGGYDADLILVRPDEVRALLSEPDVAAAVLGHGMRVAFDRTGLLDGVGLFEDVPAEVSLPTAEELRFVIQTSFHQLVWATKRFRRGELWRAIDDLNCYMKRQLLRLLEWEAVAAGRGPVYPEGRRFEHWARAEAVRALAPAYAAYDPDSVAGAIRGHLALLESAATAAIAELGFGELPPDVAAIGAWIEARLDEAGLSRPV